jgi:hypothetical protein
VKLGDLVRINNRSTSRFRDTVGVVLGRRRCYEPGRPPLVRVLIGTHEHLFDYCSLDIINENR